LSFVPVARIALEAFSAQCSSTVAVETACADAKIPGVQSVARTQVASSHRLISNGTVRSNSKRCSAAETQ